MLLGKICLFIAVAVSLAVDVSSKQVSGVDSRSEWPSFVEGSRPVGPELEQKLRKDPVGSSAYQPSNQSNQQFFKTPSKVNFHVLLQERPQDVVVKKVNVLGKGKTFSKMLFDNVHVNPIRQRAINTMFIKQMTSGTLPPSEYGGYMIQDAVYIANTAKLYKESAQMMQDQGYYDFAQFYSEQAQKYNMYYEDLLNTLRLKSTESVIIGPAFQTYMSFQQSVVKENPKLLPIAMLPCNMLWPWMADSLIGGVDKMNNPYYGEWFLKNLRQPNKRSSTEVFVDGKFTVKDEKESLRILRMGMIKEVNCFREATGEKLLTF